MKINNTNIELKIELINVSFDIEGVPVGFSLAKFKELCFSKDHLNKTLEKFSKDIKNVIENFYEILKQKNKSSEPT